jgi:transposase
MKHDMDSEDFKLSDMRIIRDNEIKHLKKRIAELEAQIPKTVVPRDIETYESGHGWWTRAWTCPSCGTRKHKGTDTQGQMPKNDAFCTCGAELNWEGK